MQHLNLEYYYIKICIKILKDLKVHRSGMKIYKGQYLECKYKLYLFSEVGSICFSSIVTSLTGVGNGLSLQCLEWIFSHSMNHKPNQVASGHIQDINATIASLVIFALLITVFGNHFSLVGILIVFTQFIIIYFTSIYLLQIL